jgi:hypothetical protein
MSIILIFFAFALIHSITVTMCFKELCRRAFGDTFIRVWYRFLYTSVSGITVVIAVYLIDQVPDRVLWQGPFWFRLIMHAIQIAGIVFGVRTFQYLDKWEFMGFRQVWRYFARNEIAGSLEGLTLKELVTTGVYGIVRHPLYVAGIIIFTFSPHITVNGLTITVLADLYFIFGMFIEERRFVRIYGDQYREYMKNVPRMVPRFFSLQGKQRESGTRRGLVIGVVVILIVLLLFCWIRKEMVIDRCLDNGGRWNYERNLCEYK